MDRIASLLFLIVFAAMAWLPLGQISFMQEHWMKIGAYLAPILLFMAFHTRSERNAPILTDIRLMACILTASYLVHQVEEHWVDFLGREYPLYQFLNAIIADVAGEERFGVLTPTAIFYVNAGMVWTVGFTAILVSPRFNFPAIAMAGLMFVNGVAHLISAVLYQSYNSGLATGVIIFIPVATLFYRALLDSHAANRKMIGAGILWGLLGHVFLFAGIFAANVYALIPVSLYYSGLIVWGLVPLMWYQSNANRVLSV